MKQIDALLLITSMVYIRVHSLWCVVLGFAKGISLVASMTVPYRTLPLAIHIYLTETEIFLLITHTDFTLVEQTQTATLSPRYKDSYIVSAKLNNHFLVPVRRVAVKRDKTLGSACPSL